MGSPQAGFVKALVTVHDFRLQGHGVAPMLKAQQREAERCAVGLHDAVGLRFMFMWVVL